MSPWPGLEPGPLAPESSALTMRPPCLPQNLKADVNILVLLNLRVYGNWRHRVCNGTSSIRMAWTLLLKFISIKAWFLMKKMSILATERG